MRPNRDSGAWVRLAGGNMGPVERRGDVVRRVAGPWTPTIGAYLEHVRARGIDWVPRWFGVADGFETLEFLPGEVPVYPLPEWVWTDEVLAEGSRRLRSLHDASVGFAADSVPGGAVWRSPIREPVEVICTNDFAPHNLVFANGRITGAIDFDFAARGPRLWDLAHWAFRAVPVNEHPDAGAPTDTVRRAELVLDSYGRDALPSVGVSDLFAEVALRLDALAHFSDAKALELANPELHTHAVSYRADAAHARRLAGDL